MVAAGLSRLHPGIAVRFVWVESEGDQVTAGPLSAAGGKGLFIKAVERVVLAGDADLAVHSMKDIPADEQTPGLQIAAIPRRADVRDVLVARGGKTTIQGLPHGACLGTSSPRRAAQVLQARPDLTVQPIRGNVGTRLQQVTQEGAGPDATLLAAAGLSRLGLHDRLAGVLPVEQVLPAAGQGALGIQCRRDDHVSLIRCLPLNDPKTSTAVHAERGVVAGLGADCHSPIAVLAEQVDPDESRAHRNADSHWFRLRVRVMSGDGTRVLTADERCKTNTLRRLVAKVVGQLTDQGAKDLLRACHGLPTDPCPAPIAASRAS